MAKHLEKKEAAERKSAAAPQKKNPRRRRKTKRTSVIGTVVLLFLVLVLVSSVSLFYLSNRMLNQIERVDKSEEVWMADTIVPENVVWTRPKTAVQKPKIKNILLIGQDRRSGETRARSDSMILCSINEYTKELTLTSLMRDMYVPYPGDYYPSRINHAFAWGGMSLLDQLIEEDFGITIDGNVVVDFDGFIQVMDLIAPLEIDLRDDEAWCMNLGNKNWMLHTGVNALNGEQRSGSARC